VFPAAKTDREGWPIGSYDSGQPVPLRLVTPTVYRGSFVVPTAGDYVVVDFSSLAMHQARENNVVVSGTYPAPVRLRVDTAPLPATAASPKSHSSGSSVPPTLYVLIGVVAAVALGAAFAVRRRHPRPELTTDEDDEEEPVRVRSGTSST
jgi:MYXO-CTERM domain-containing protein